jgi:hypothetical protein
MTDEQQPQSTILAAISVVKGKLDQILAEIRAQQPELRGIDRAVALATELHQLCKTVPELKEVRGGCSVLKRSSSRSQKRGRTAVNYLIFLFGNGLRHLLKK